MELRYKLIPSPNGFTVDPPSFASDSAAGLDLRACIDAPMVVAAGVITSIPLGVAVEIPQGHFGLMASRSSLAVRHGVSLANSIGVIDADYRGQLHAALINLTDKAYTIQPGERIVQLIITPFVAAVPTQAVELSPTPRGDGGYGSTGKF